ncbi:HpcH/HpaI aldolase/citrate lyase family protein [Ottowia thiooxydans]|uniref:HpcH/HpaI aldolase/citrate lyase family protein n=1 Tax=Ottowia thiooxydans TaxID=219182 RepID=UPI00042557BD|nr:CoA ester lyase [Ottowia thiooxydans]
METNSIQPRRCMLLVPGSSLRMIEKAAASDADVIMIDLDDAVVYDDVSKTGAQKTLIESMKTIDFGQRQVVVRINSTDMPWWQDDIRACVTAGIGTIVPPKCDTPEDLMKIVRFLESIDGAEEMRMWPMIETTGAIIHCERIAAEVPRLTGMCFGIGDYTVAVGAHFVDIPDRVLYPLSKLVCVARYHGLVALAPAVAFSNMNRDSIIEEWGAFLRRLGFDGALVVHPKHVATINKIFTPSREEIDAALEMRDAIAEARASNKAAVIIGGKLIEKVNIDLALRTLYIAERLGLLDGQPV